MRFSNSFLLHSILWFPIGAYALGSYFSFNLGFSIALSALSATHSVAPFLLVQHDDTQTKQSMTKAILLTLLICCGLVIFSFQYAKFDSTAISSGFFILALAYFTFNTWHFSMQNYGILSLIRKTKGFDAPSASKTDRLFCFTHGFLCIPLLWLPEKRHLGVLFDNFPELSHLLPWNLMSVFLVVAAFVVYLVFMYIQRTMSAGRFIYSLGMATQVLVISHSSFLMAVVVYFVPHWIAELSLVIRALPEKKFQFKKGFKTPLAYGACLFLLINYLVVREFPFIRQWFSSSSVPNDLLLKQDSLVALACIGFFLIVFSHYFADRLVFRRGSPALKRLVELNKYE